MQDLLEEPTILYFSDHLIKYNLRKKHNAEAHNCTRFRVNSDIPLSARMGLSEVIK